MKPISETRSETAFDDYKTPLTPRQALVESMRCFYCEDAPCAIACPTHIDVAQFIRKISTDNLQGSAKTIFASNILGMSCARVCPVEVLCEGSCVYHGLDSPPIAIGRLQRFATDAAFDAGWRFGEAGADTGKSIGLIGGGPASLAAAYELRLQGHSCTIYEKRDVLGGLNTTGVAPYKMKADRSVAEVDWILAIGGIDVKTGVEIGEGTGQTSWSDLEAAHDALFLGFGLGPDRYLAGAEDMDGVHGAVDFIERMKLGDVDLSGVENAVILGGGNTAIDAVRAMLGLGIPSVSMVYRGNEAGKSGYAHEWKIAKISGAKGVWQTQPVGFEGAGTVTGVSCVSLDAEKKVIAGSEHSVKADLVLLAIGQSKLEGMVAGFDGVETKWGCVQVDDTGATGRPGVYAGGDCISGGKEVVNAVAEGKMAAQAIGRYLNGEGE